MVDGQGLGATLVGGGVHSPCSRRPSHDDDFCSSPPFGRAVGALADLEHLPNQLGGHTSDLYMAMLSYHHLVVQSVCALQVLVNLYSLLLFRHPLLHP